MRLAALSFLPLASLVAVAACSAPADELTNTGGDAVTGVTDLSAVEAELGLVKDTKDAAGNWTRSEAKLAAGPCYKQTVGSTAGARYEFRRYTKGAAFFTKLGSGSASGNKRPIACVDVDVDDSVSGEAASYALAGLALDTTMRYHLGRALGSEGGLGHLYLDFDRGEVEFSESGHYCGLFGEGDGRDPGPQAWALAITTCKQQGLSEEVCTERAMTACRKAVDADVVADTVDRPAFPAIDTDTPTYFYHLRVASADPKAESSYVAGTVASLVYRYAKKVAVNRNEFTLDGDPVGKFVSVDEVNPDNDTTTQHVRFEKLDAHRLRTFGLERLVITPKGADDKVLDEALVLCTRSLGFEGQATAPFQCRGI